MAIFSGLLLSLITILFGVFLYLKHKFSYWSDKRVKCIQPSFVNLMGNMNGVGHSVHYVKRLQDIYTKFCETKDLYCGIYFMTTPKLLALNLEFVSEVIENDFNTFHDRGTYYNESTDPLSANLYNLEGEKWLTLRNKMKPIFTAQKMKSMLESVLDIGDELKDVIDMHQQQKSVLNAKDICMRFSSDVIGAYSLALTTNALKKGDSNLLNMASKIYNYKSPLQKCKFFIQNSYGNIAKMFGLRVYTSDVEDFFKNTIEKTIKYREINNFLDRSDFLTLLLQIKNEGHVDDDQSAQNLGTFTTADLNTQVFMLFLAGLDTLATTMTYCLYELSMDQDIQDKVRAEIKTALDKNGGKLTYESISGMEYMDRVVNETLRKYSPVHTLYRITNKRYSVPGTDYTIPTGTRVVIPVYAIHHDPNIYVNPEKFDPDRFTAENVQKRPKHSFLAFGDGPRNCIGQQFGRLNIKMGLCMMLAEHKFSVNLDTETPLELDPANLLLEPKGGILLNVYKP